MDEKQQKQLLSKLRQPLHISYIANNILKENMFTTKEIINSLIEQDIVEESKYAKEYYVIKNK